MVRFGLLSVVLGGMALLVSGCGDAQSAHASETMVNLRTVQSGPAIQAAELNGAIARQPRNAGLYARRAAYEVEANNLTEALRDINRALELDDEAPGDYYLIKARALRAQGRLLAAIDAAAQAQQRGYNPPELHLLLGETNLAARRYRTALDYLDRVLRDDADNASALFYKGLVYSALRDTAQALDFLRASVVRAPRQPEALHQLAYLLNANNQPLAAAPYIERGLKVDPTYATLWYDRGRVFDLSAQPDSAARQYARAAFLDSTLYRADYRLGMFRYKNKRYAQAIRPLSRAQRRSQYLPDVGLMLADCYEQTGQNQLAWVAYRQLVKQFPGNRHYTYKVWKVGQRLPAPQLDSLKLVYGAPPLPRRAPAAVRPSFEPLEAKAPTLQTLPK
ncbi:tetratricopeptide repeat protein [Hymenobacter busanensis]|uniref:Tetratricopeptide repeat protein n=1 Tax=Hymenobacter busanensis TaxID=2607656 RepID=A0A7L4ZUD4_9BACT|nr:tetratricopeptide repeat protein [Hymenobacter busanensis]KAA9339811.1 tetratricopeptide repeat protein [Hymenobacter busanensis]QHJ06435.1 tetratricopeptide repeat protein [Hymenobacter busanensis]